MDKPYSSSRLINTKYIYIYFKKKFIQIVSGTEMQLSYFQLTDFTQAAVQGNIGLCVKVHELKKEQSIPGIDNKVDLPAVSIRGR